MGIIKSRIFVDSGLLLQEYSGEIEKKDMSDYLAELYSSPEYLSVSIIHSDFTKANAILSVKDLTEIAYFILRHAPKVQLVKNSILVSKPLTTAYSLIYSTIMKAMPLYECKIFSTLNEAANFISRDADELQELMEATFIDS
jgi:hypothetical protein